MRNYLLVVAFLFAVGCKSKAKNETVTTENKPADTTVSTQQNPPDSTASTTPPPAGKIDIETFGPLRLGMPYKETVNAMGQPGRKGDAVEWAADGLVHQDWRYLAEGIVLNISFEKDQLLQTGAIFAITATSPCVFKTKAGMGIGSTYAEVQEAYKRDIDPEATDKTQITVGSVYGGIIFSFKNDKAEKIFIGAAAE
ncbi:MAG: hypothetical protein ABIR30_11515 [Chitinophagaceae bacterium]